MSQYKLRYQPVISSEGTVGIHEVILDSEGNVKSATYEPIKLESTSVGELEELLRTIYRHIRTVKPITDDELDSLLYGVDRCDVEDEDSNVIDLVDFFAREQ